MSTHHALEDSARQQPIEDHAFLSDQRSSALVTREGTIPWLCMPRFDSPAMFAALLGTAENGHWSLQIEDGEVVEREYLPGTMILRTRWRGPRGEAEVLDLMPISDQQDSCSVTGGDLPDRSDVLRRVRCLEGEVTVTQQIRIRFHYGERIPWVSRRRQGEDANALVAIAGRDGVVIHGPDLAPADSSHVGTSVLTEGEEQAWSLTWFPSWFEAPEALDAQERIEVTAQIWRDWLGKVRPTAEYAEHVERSLLVLRGLTHRMTGGMVAASTASLPEDFGGERNWDYRFCWLRDASLSLEALLAHGHTEAARSWRDWLLRAIAGEMDELRIMYTLSGDREMEEKDLEHLPGYADSRPVHIGNGAADQYQADVIGEVMLALGMLRDAGEDEDAWSWPLQKRLVGFALENFEKKDQGLWEMRGEPHYFTHGRIMMWAAFDRALHAVHEHGLPAAEEEITAWEKARDELREEIMTRGVDENGAFVQHYDTTEVDASLLQIPHTGFLPADDPHMLATVKRIEEDLVDEHGFVIRYRTTGVDGLEGHEAPFVICTFWLVEQYARSGRMEDARKLMNSVCDSTNDLLLMAEEYDPVEERMVGNFPQAFSHLGLIRAVDAMEGQPVS